MKTEFVRLDVICNVQARNIERYGGLAGVRDMGVLESAISRPRNLQAYEDQQSVPVLAAAVAWGILRNHPFHDGNKRAAFAALAITLEINGYVLTCSEVEETGMVLRAAAGDITEPEWTAWVVRSTVEEGPER